MYYLLTFILTIALCLLIFRLKKSSFTHLGNEILQKADKDAKLLEVKTKYEIEQHKQKEYFEIQRAEERAQEQEKKNSLKSKELQKNLRELETKSKKLEEERERVKQAEKEIYNTLLAISKLSQEEAEKRFFTELKEKRLAEISAYLEKSQQEMVQEANVEAARLVAIALGKVAGEKLSEMTIVPIALSSDDMKGRLIGREGKNIRLFETLTGISLIIDETPKTVYISGFDDERKEVAKTALKQLLKDGRIHPTRIEEVVLNAKEGVTKSIHAKGKELARKAHIFDLDPKLIELLGKLHFRHSLGQNVAYHSLEVSQIMGSFAAELGLDARAARRIGLLHDIGKALDDTEKSHALAGHDLALRFGESSIVANGIGCHHNEMKPASTEAALISVADTISSSRLGARSQTSEQYYNRLKQLEKLCLDFEGVKEAFAMQAGREIKLIVEPELIDDAAMTILAKKVADKIEDTMSFGGNIKVTVLREQKAVEWAK